MMRPLSGLPAGAGL